jgi:hypothetical protein
VQEFEIYSFAVPPAESVTIRGAAENYADQLIHPLNA